MSEFEPAAIDGASLPHRVVVGAVVAYKDYRRYASRDEVLAALEDLRGPALSNADFGVLLDLSAAAHDAAVHAVRVHRRQRRFKVFTSEKDIDKPRCLREMEDAAPGLPPAVQEYLLGWVIHWYYVR